MDKLRMQSSNGVEDNIMKIAQLFPDCVTETVDERSGQPKHLIDFEKLKQNLSDSVMSERAERYQFTWPDKSKAILLANSPINATLRPCREDCVDFDNTQNLYIEGDNLDVLKCLKETYLHKVKMIYIDPPYNTGNDFVYEDDFAQSSEEYLANSGQFDEQGNRMFTNAESNGRFHTDWLNLLYSRLKIARDLLTSDGYIFISIDENEIANLQKISNEIFGESNHYATFIIIRSEGGGLAKNAVIGHDYLLIYTKNKDKAIPLGRPKDIRGKVVAIDGEDYWIETDWFREVFGKYGTCHYEDILKFYDQSKKNEIDQQLKKGTYILIEKNGKHIIGRYRKVADDTSKFYTILKHLNKKGVEDLKQIGLNKFFDYPKPVSLLKDLILGTTIKSKRDNNIILDFFSGSATTAHAVMQLNSEDGGNRKFIMVQLPEKTDEKSEAFKAGYKNICEIGKERIRRAGKKIKEESPLTTQDLDTGFRVLKLDSTNMQDIYYSPKDISQADLFSQVDNVKPDRTGEDLLFQVMLELGATLDSKIETTMVAGKTIYNVAEGYLVACFDPDVTDDVVKAIAQMQPAYAVLRDTSMKDDSTATNFEQIFKTYSPDTVTKIL